MTWMKFSLLVFFMTNVAWFGFSPFCTTSIILIIFFMFPSGMWTFHEGMLGISHTSSEIVSMLSNCKVKLFFYPLLWILLLWFFCSLITNANLFKQYPKARHKINCLPASDLAGACYKPEAHLLIKKFLSLKKENKQNFIDNMIQHTEVRIYVSIINHFLG